MSGCWRSSNSLPFVTESALRRVSVELYTDDTRFVEKVVYFWKKRIVWSK